MKKKFSKVFATLMVCLIAFLFVGCDDSPDNFDINNMSGVLDLYGAKVLYRPDEYDFNLGSGGTAGEKNDYYGKYAWNILNTLYSLYGIPSYFVDYPSYFGKNAPPPVAGERDDYHYYDTDSKTWKYTFTPYLYDSIRYQVNVMGNVTASKQQGSAATTEVTNKIILAADTSKTWNWSFKYNSENILSYLPKSAEPQIVTINSIPYYVYHSNFQSAEGNIEIHYSNSGLQTNYRSAFLGATEAIAYEDYSPFVKAMEYVVYSYALDLEPKEITVAQTPSTIDGVTYPYTVSVLSYSDINEALSDIQNLFKRIGTFVGLTQRQIGKITNYVKRNVIGGNLQNKGTFTTYENITQITDAEGKVIGFETSPAGSATHDIRQYDRIVDAVVENVCKLVSIGNDGSGDVTVDKRFLASSISEYAGECFIQGVDSFFQNPESNPENKPYIYPLEYQSVVLMLSKPTILSELWVALKYDADLDGTEENVYDKDKYLDIIVELNYYNHDYDKFFTLASQKSRVYDGPYDPEAGSRLGLSDDHGLVRLEIDEEALGSLKAEGKYNNGVRIGAFNPDIGGGILKTDVGQNDYKSPALSQNPLVLVGNTDVKKYYQIIEAKDEELGSSDFTYTTGRLNEKMFAGSDGCDYLEITYKVLKRVGDTSTNYKFYTAVNAIWNTDPL